MARRRVQRSAAARSDSSLEPGSALLRGLLPVTAGLAALHVVLSIVYQLTLPRATATVMSPVAAATTLVLVGLILLLRRGSIPASWGHATGAGIAGLILVNSLLHLALTGALWQTAFLLLLIGGAGFLFLSTAWLALLVGATLASWGAVVLGHPSIAGGSPGAAIRFGVALPLATALAALVHAARVRLLQLHQHTAELKQRNEELDAFAHTVAHVLKNPLQNIVGYADLLRSRYDDLSDQARQEALTDIVATTDAMDRIIGELLLFSEVRRGEAVTQELDMASIVVAAQARLRHMIDHHQAEIVVPETWPAAQGYAAWIEDVWTNYLSNAVKYGGRPPRVEIGGARQDDGDVRFWVRDNGPGLTAEEQASLFTPFTRLGQNGADGHGLGLSIVRRIIDRLGGQAGVESTVGEGSIFYFTLPQA